MKIIKHKKRWDKFKIGDTVSRPLHIQDLTGGPYVISDILKCNGCGYHCHSNRVGLRLEQRHMTYCFYEWQPKEPIPRWNEVE